MLRSAGFRFMVVGMLTLFMFIPLFFVSSVIDSRADYSRATIQSVGREWGGEQLISGPQLVIPVSEEVKTSRRRDVVDPATGQVLRDLISGNVIYEYFEETSMETRAPVYLFPDTFFPSVDTTTEERHRGIFVVPVYSAETKIEFNFPIEDAAIVLVGKEVLDWDAAEVRVFLTSNRALRGQAGLRVGDAELSLEPLPSGDNQRNGIFAETGDPRKAESYQLVLGFNGAQSLSVTAAGRDSRIAMQSDWPHPSFFAAFLPDSSEISDIGFTAKWTIPHLVRALPQISRENFDSAARNETAFGVRFFQPNDFYQKAFRAARMEYCLLP